LVFCIINPSSEGKLLATLPGDGEFVLGDRHLPLSRTNNSNVPFCSLVLSFLAILSDCGCPLNVEKKKISPSGKKKATAL
jgi:hypothetical protein